jgi:multidrug efflux pump subunit AcrA (membrane-fusion protein)
VVAYIGEIEAPLVRVGQPIYFTVLVYPDRPFPAKVSYVATALDPITRRLLVRASVDNSASLLKPEMFPSVKILTGEGATAIAVLPASHPLNRAGANLVACPGTLEPSGSRKSPAEAGLI